MARSAAAGNETAPMLTTSMPLPGDDEFPAGRHHIIARILQLISMRNQRRDDHLVIAVLRETQPFAGQFAGQAQQLQVGLWTRCAG